MPSLAADQPSFYYTTSTFNLTNSALLASNNVLGTGVSPASHNGPYTTSQFLSTAGHNRVVDFLAGRVLSAGIRVTYTGTTLNESGTITCYHSPDHGSAEGGNSADLQSNTGAEVKGFTRHPCELIVHPINADEVSYLRSERIEHALWPFYTGNSHETNYEGGTAYTNQLGADGNTFYTPTACAIIAVTGVPGSTFQIDYMAHMEFVGRAASSSLTPNEMDVSGAQAVLASAAGLLMRKQAYEGISNWEAMYEGLKSVMAPEMNIPADIHTLVQRL
jgi:hypothetical protein